MDLPQKDMALSIVSCSFDFFPIPLKKTKKQNRCVIKLSIYGSEF